MAKKKPKTNPENEVPIEQAMAELQQIVDTLESGQTPLMDSMSQYERGMNLLKTCHQQLEQAAQRIEIVTGVDRDGNAVTAPFDGTATAAVKATPPPRQTNIAEPDDDEDGVDPASLF